MLTNGALPQTVDIIPLAKPPIHVDRSLPGRRAQEGRTSNADDSSYGRSLQRELRKEPPASANKSTQTAPAAVDNSPPQSNDVAPNRTTDRTPTDRDQPLDAESKTETTLDESEQAVVAETLNDTPVKDEAFAVKFLDVLEFRPESDLENLQSETKASDVALEDTALKIHSDRTVTVESTALAEEQRASLNTVVSTSFVLQAPASFELGTQALPIQSVSEQQLVAADPVTEVVAASTEIVHVNVPPPKNLRLAATTQERTDDTEVRAARSSAQAIGNSQPPESLFASTSIRVGEHRAVAVPIARQTEGEGVEQVRVTEVITKLVDGPGPRLDAGPTIPNTQRVEPGSTVVVAAAEPEVPVDQARVVERVSQMIRTSEQSGRVLRARLHPPELGALQIEVTRGATGIIARLDVETPAAHRLIMDHISQLQDALSLTGHVERIDVQIAPSSESNTDEAPPDAWSFGGQQQSEDNDGRHQDESTSQDQRSANQDEPADDSGEQAVHSDPRVEPHSRSINLSELDIAI
ncbi:MAG: flagellar hook-length control protein FliK [Planctomycetota bacterium]|nr:flagellar hook-length control protein FliK [Planctomycetota bacterium]